MRREFTLALLAAAISPCNAQDPCPVESMNAIAIDAALQKAPDCKSAFAIMRNCLFIASPDVQFAAVVVDKCEAEFAAKLSAAQSHRYQSARAKCDKKYANMEGSMYLSFGATCKASLAAQYARKLAKGE